MGDLAEFRETRLQPYLVFRAEQRPSHRYYAATLRPRSSGVPRRGVVSTSDLSSGARRFGSAALAACQARGEYGLGRQPGAGCGHCLLPVLGTAIHQFYLAVSSTVFSGIRRRGRVSAALLHAADSARPRARRAWTAAALFLAVAGSYSMANGILIWPILLLAAIWLGASRGTLCALGACGIAVFAQYLHGWHTAPLDGLAPLWRIAVFALANAGSPVLTLVYTLGGGASAAGTAATLIGGLLMVYTAVHWVLLWRHRERYSGARVVLLHFAVYVAAASFAISVGRAHLPLIEAFRSRYITPPYILWACLLCVAWPRLRSLASDRIRWAIVATVLLFGIARYQTGRFREAREYRAGLRRAAVALAVGVNDPAGVEDLYRPTPAALPSII